MIGCARNRGVLGPDFYFVSARVGKFDFGRGRAACGRDHRGGCVCGTTVSRDGNYLHFIRIPVGQGRKVERLRRPVVCEGVRSRRGRFFNCPRRGSRGRFQI